MGQPRTWFRIDAKARRSRDEVLRSGGLAGFHEDLENEPTCYAADSLMTAWQGISARIGVPRDPRAFRAWQITVPGARLVDLRDSEEQTRRGIGAEELKADPAPLSCKTVARKLRQEPGMNGLICESVRNPGGTCVAFFLESGIEALTCDPVDDRWEEFIRDAGL